MSEVSLLNSEIEGFLTLSGVDTFFVSEFITAVSEILMNAYEHGSLNIGFRSKQKLVRDGFYEEHLLRLEADVDKKIAAVVSLFEENEMQFIMAVVTDEGNGFDTSIIKESVRDIELLHYRGIKIAKGLVDEIYYIEKGNEVTLIKRMPVMV